VRTYVMDTACVDNHLCRFFKCVCAFYCRCIDQNDSGTVSYREFIFAFFRSRDFRKRCRTKIGKMDETELRHKFMLANKNKDGKLKIKVINTHI
jgi:hypothetical protein